MVFLDHSKYLFLMAMMAEMSSLILSRMFNHIIIYYSVLGNIYSDRQCGSVQYHLLGRKG